MAQDSASWRKMTTNELKKAVPEKAPVIKENIETEFRTAAGITNGGKNIFGVVIITAGYEAENKYTHFFRTDLDIKAGDLGLSAGEYVFGYRKVDNEHLLISFYNAHTGELVGAVKAKLEPNKGAIYSFYIEPPVTGKGRIFIGRFVFEYDLAVKQ
jgi:hypothetical protein